MHEQNEGSRRIHRALLDLIADIGGYQTLDELLRSLSGHLRELTPFDQLAVVLHDNDTGRMRIALQEPPGLVPHHEFPFTDVPVDFGPAGWVWSSQQTHNYSLVAEQTHVTLQYLRTEGYRAACFVPLTTPRAQLGTLGFASRHIECYPEESVSLMARIARLLALAIEHTTQIEQLARTTASLTVERDRTRLLLEVSAAVSSELNLADLLAAMSRLLLDKIPHHFASITLWDEQAGQLRRRALVFPEGRGIIEKGALVGSPSSPSRIAFDRGKTTILRWADIESLDPYSARVMAEEGLRSVCCVPLQTGRSRYGTLNVAKPEDVAFEPAEVQLLEQVSQELAVAIENAVHFERAEQYRRDAMGQRDHLRLLLDVTNALVSNHDALSFQPSVFSTIRAAVPHDQASLAILDPGAQALRLEAITSYDEHGVTEPHTMLPMERTPWGMAFAERKSRVFDDLDQFDPQATAVLRDAGMRSVCCVPLTTRRGVVGTLNIASRNHPWQPEQVSLLVDVARQIAIAVENTLAFREISDLKDRLNDEKLYLEDEIIREHDFKEIIGTSRVLARVLDQIRTVAPTDATVLLLGETGTGKELLARALHDLSRRRERTFVRISGAALPAGLIESELFGYEKGAFTGAVSSRAGRLEIADRGTLFLDEVGDIPIEVQPKLLRVLQEREFERLGSTRTQRVDVRLIAATNRNLGEMASTGAFRSDLYYRLSVFPIQVPPLRERAEDIPALVRHFVDRVSRRLGREIATIPRSTMEELQRWPWPGNIRELQNVIERAVILSRGNVLQVPPGIFERPSVNGREAAPAEPIRSGDYRSGEREMILRALRESKGVIGGSSGAAARLGLKRTTLHSKMRKLGIARPSY